MRHGDRLLDLSLLRRGIRILRASRLLSITTLRQRIRRPVGPLLGHLLVRKGYRLDLACDDILLEPGLLMRHSWGRELAWCRSELLSAGRASHKVVRRNWGDGSLGVDVSIASGNRDLGILWFCGPAILSLLILTLILIRNRSRRSLRATASGARWRYLLSRLS